jgi:voltage-gated sodium channel
MWTVESKYAHQGKPSLDMAVDRSKKNMGPRASTRLQSIEEHSKEGNDFQIKAIAMVESHTFDIFIGIAIGLNAVSIGVEQTLQINGHSTTALQIVESAFLCIYIFEFACRFAAYSVECLRDNWVKFDLFLVVLGILNTWILEPAVGETPSALSLLMVLRVLRLLRIFKTARMFKQIVDFWRLIRGLLNSATIMIYTLILLLLMLYVFSSLAVELITKHRLNMGSEPDEEFQEQVRTYFRTVPLTMLTLLQFATLDDMAKVYMPLIDKDPWLTLYFVLLVLVVSIVLMNLVAAVIISSILEQEQDEHDDIQRSREEEWATLIRDLKDMFLRLDEDRSGHLSREEVLCMDNADLVKLNEALGVSSPIEVFNALDVDGNGEVSINEFFDGIWDVVLAKGAVDFKRLEKQVETMHWRLKETFSLQHEIRLNLDKMNRRFDILLEDQGKLDDCSQSTARKSTYSNSGNNTSIGSNLSGRASTIGTIGQINDAGTIGRASTMIGLNDKVTTSPRSTPPPDMPEWAKELTQSIRKLANQKRSASGSKDIDVAKLKKSASPAGSKEMVKIKEPKDSRTKDYPNQTSRKASKGSDSTSKHSEGQNRSGCFTSEGNQFETSQMHQPLSEQSPEIQSERSDATTVKQFTHPSSAAQAGDAQAKRRQPETFLMSFEPESEAATSAKIDEGLRRL